jgi:hypothetical protein
MLKAANSPAEALNLMRAFIRNSQEYLFRQPCGTRSSRAEKS